MNENNNISEKEKVMNDDFFKKNKLIAHKHKLGVVTNHSDAGLEVFIYHPNEENIEIPYESVYASTHPFGQEARFINNGNTHS